MKYFIFFIFISPVVSQTSLANAKFENFNEYFPNLVQETIYEVERRGWWNLKLQDLQVNINERIYDRNFEGSVLYTNGFLVSIQRIDLTGILQSISANAGTMTGDLNLHNAVVGYDVIANLTDLGVHRFTGIFDHNSIQYRIRVLKTLNTGVITTAVSLTSLSAGRGNYMRYMPDNYISEVLSKHYTPGDVWDGVASWGRQVMAPIMLNLTESLGFPEICFNC